MICEAMPWFVWLWIEFLGYLAPLWDSNRRGFCDLDDGKGYAEMTTTTQIGLTPSGQLFLELPGKDGQPRQINLVDGQAERILKLLLREQRAEPSIGRDAGATWRFLLEADLLEALARHPIQQVPMGVSRQSKTQASPEELGL